MGNKKKEYHRREDIRIENELKNLGPEFHEDGIVKTILRERICDEKRRSKWNQMKK